VAVGLVISQDPADGGTVDIGTDVDFVVSLGPEPVLVPDVVGETQEDAETALEADSFVPHVVEQYSESVAEGLVILQSPIAGAASTEGATVTIYVSLGPQPPGTKKGSQHRHGHRSNWKHGG
jgi:beta-lactam-binding protein with PASTA domain